MHFVRVAFVLAAIGIALPVSARPSFAPESISDFAAAFATLKTARLNMAKTWTLDARHTDPSRYHAYRFILPDTVMIGIAENVTVDAAGHVRFTPERGASLSGRANKTHREYSHILVPISVAPPM